MIQSPQPGGSALPLSSVLSPPTLSGAQNSLDRGRTPVSRGLWELALLQTDSSRV